jgi:hypothetical protein
VEDEPLRGGVKEREREGERVSKENKMSYDRMQNPLRIS